MNDFTPRIILFCCNWNVYATTDLTDTSTLTNDPHFRVIRTMCSGKIEPSFIFQAFAQGVDGVMVAGCNPGDCHYNSGNFKARRRLMLLNNILLQFGIEPERLKMEWIPASEASKFQSTVNGFIDEVTKLGPLTLNARATRETG